MPGLSADPEKRQRQLDALAAGREKGARALLGLEPPEPRQSPGSAPAPPAAPATAEPISYPDDESDHEPEPEPEPEPRREADPEPGDAGRSSGLGAFFEGFVGGA